MGFDITNMLALITNLNRRPIGKITVREFMESTDCPPPREQIDMMLKCVSVICRASPIISIEDWTIDISQNKFFVGLNEIEKLLLKFDIKRAFSIDSAIEINGADITIIGESILFSMYNGKYYLNEVGLEHLRFLNDKLFKFVYEGE